MEHGKSPASGNAGLSGGLPAGFVADAPTLRGPVSLVQDWTDLAFLHWAVDPDVVAPLLPRGTRPDVLGATTYVGLVPFRMKRTRIGPHVPVPHLGGFLETNVRLYSVDDDGRRGVVFRSLEAQRLVAVLTARAALRLPYFWARMGAQSNGSDRVWTTQRLVGQGRSRIALRVGAPVEPTFLDTWLTARWGLHTRIGGRTCWLPNAHVTWPLHTAEVVALDDGLVRRGGVHVEGPPTVPVRWSPGVRTAFGVPVPLVSARR